MRDAADIERAGRRREALSAAALLGPAIRPPAIDAGPLQAA
jgi:hypothetical protein